MPRSWALRMGALILVLMAGPSCPQAWGDYYSYAWIHDPATPGDWFDPANWALIPGYYSRVIDNGGTATVSYGNVGEGDVFVGGGECSSMVQSGSSTFATSLMYLGAMGEPGRYTLNDTATFDCMEMFLGDNGPGEFIQNGGVSTVGKVDFYNGSYRLCGGVLESNAVRIDGPTCQLIQTGGSIQGFMCSIQVAGIFRLEDGVVNARWASVDYGGSFIQNGGSVTLRDPQGLRIYSNVGNTYSIAGGSVTVKGSLAVGLPATGYAGTGELSIADGRAAISVGSLQLYPAAILTAGAGSAIRVNGPAVDNQSTDEAALAGLGNLDLIVEGTGPTTLEAAGKDLGAVTAGFHRNFSLARLHLGGANPGQVRLVDAFDNQPALPEAEALYVTSLDLSAGSQLDLNGLHLYYITARIDPLATIIGGAPTPVAALPGDADLDGTADFADYQTMEANFGDATTFGWAHGDFDGDGDVDFTDYQMLEANFGQSVPEPVSLWLLGMGGAGLLASGRKLRKKAAARRLMSDA